MVADTIYPFKRCSVNQSEACLRTRHASTPERHKKGQLPVKDFAITQLESRLEMFCIPVPYIGTCWKRVWFVWIPYPCVKYRWICF
jgi:hypothetical protein